MSALIQWDDRCAMTTPLIQWEDNPRWGVAGHNVHHGTTDDLGDHGRHSDETEEE